MENIKLKNWNDPEIYPVWKDESEPYTIYNLDGIHVPLIDGIEILIFPKYKECQLLPKNRVNDWISKNHNNPLYAEVDQKQATDELLALGSEAAEYVRQFDKDLPLPIQLVAIARYKEKIDELSMLIGGDLLIDIDADLIDIDKDFWWSCVRFTPHSVWSVYGNHGDFDYTNMWYGNQVVPVSIYKKKCS